jgi:hypothetical protein
VLLPPEPEAGLLSPGHLLDCGATVMFMLPEPEGVGARRLALVACSVPREPFPPAEPEWVLELFSASGFTVVRNPGTASMTATTITSAPAAASAGRSQVCAEPGLNCLRAPDHSRLSSVDCPLAMRTSSLAGTRNKTIKTLGR